MPKDRAKMNAVTQYKLHKFLTDLSKKEDIDVFVACTWKQRLMIFIGLAVGGFLAGPLGIFVGALPLRGVTICERSANKGIAIGYMVGQKYMNRKYKALQILEKMDSSQRENLHQKGKEILGETNIKTLEHLAENDEEAKEKMVNHLQEYLGEVIVKEQKAQASGSEDVSVV